MHAKVAPRGLHPINRAEADKIVLALQALEQRAMRANLFISQRGINNAINAIGWELAENNTRAEMATRGLRSDHQDGVHR